MFKKGNKEKYLNVAKYISKTYYDNPNTIFTVKNISSETNVDIIVVKEVLSLINKKTYLKFPFKMKYEEVLKINKIRNDFHISFLNLLNSYLSIVSICYIFYKPSGFEMEYSIAFVIIIFCILIFFLHWIIKKVFNASMDI